MKTRYGYMDYGFSQKLMTNINSFIQKVRLRKKLSQCWSNNKQQECLGRRTAT